MGRAQRRCCGLPPPGPPRPPSTGVDATAVAGLAALAATIVGLDGTTVAWTGKATVPAVAATVTAILTLTARVARVLLSRPAARLFGRVSSLACLVHWPV